MYCIVGLGNPGTEHEYTRHNAGRMALAPFLRAHDFPTVVPTKKYASLTTESDITGERVLVLFPETYMNKSGSAVKKAVTSAKKAEKLIVVYDDLDLPLGAMKISFGRGAGGHKGVESILRALKTKNFTRIRVGIAPTTPSGKLKKPKGEDKVVQFLLSDFKKSEHETLKKVAKKVNDALTTLIAEGLPTAMNWFN